MLRNITGVYFIMTILYYTFAYKFHTNNNLSKPIEDGAPVAQWVKRWPTDLADRVRSSFEVKSSHP